MACLMFLRFMNNLYFFRFRLNNWIFSVCAPPPFNVLILFARPDARAIFLYNYLLCNSTCCAIGGSITWGGGGGHEQTNGLFCINNSWIFSVCAPPPSTLCAPQLQSTCHYIVNHYVKIWHVRLGGANNMRPLSWGGGGGHKRKRS